MKRFALALCPVTLLAVSMVTGHFGNSRTGANTAETILNPANVAVGSFGKLHQCNLDGAVYAQPLYAPITIAGLFHNALLVSTMNNSIYLLDSSSCATLWHSTFGTPLTSYPSQNCGSQDCLLYGNKIGCLSTPVIDQTNSLVYAVCATATPSWVLYELSLTTGATVNSVTVTGSVTGTGDPGGGDCESAGTLTFCPEFELQRSALTEANGNIYIMAGSFSDIRPWHGWAFAYNASTLAQVAVYCTSANQYGAGLWGASGGFTVLGNGNLVMETGNGTYDGSAAWGETFLQFTPTLGIADWFTPSNWSNLNSNDEDLSSSRAMLIPGSSYVVGGAKDFNVRAVLTSCMGHLGGTVGGCTAAQTFLTTSGTPGPHVGIYGGVFVNNEAYFPTTAGQIYGFAWSGTSFNTTPITSASSYAYPGAQLSASSNGASDTIIWAVTVASSAENTEQTGTLRAFNSSLSELWNSDQRTGDALGDVAKFDPPIAINGNVFVGTLSGVAVYGLLNTPDCELSGVAGMSGAASLN